jgi:hypothetical protein
MKRHNLDETFFTLLYGDLSPEEVEELISQLERSGISRKEIDSMRSFKRLVDESPLPESSEKMDKEFYSMLKEMEMRALIGADKVNRQRLFFGSLLTPGLKVAAGIALFILGWFAAIWSGGGFQGENRQVADLASDVKELKETLILTMIQQSSSVERIRAVNMVSEFDQADDRIIESLISVLNHDSNDNVRLIALDALIRYSGIPEVMDGLVSSISYQTSPMVQLRLTEIMLALDEKRAIPEFKKMLQNSSLNYNVRGKISEAIEVLL